MAKGDSVMKQQQVSVAIYASGRGLSLTLLASLAGVVGFTALAAYLVTRDYSHLEAAAADFQQLLRFAALVLGVPIVIPSLLVYFFAALSRVLVPRPTLSITPEGIVDHCSLVAGGLGLIRWEDIAAVYPARFANQPYVRSLKNTYLVIRPVAPDVVLRGRGAIARLLRRLLTMSYRDPLDVFIPALMLSIPVSEVASKVRAVYEAQRAHDRALRAMPPIRIAEALPERIG